MLADWVVGDRLFHRGGWVCINVRTEEVVASAPIGMSINLVVIADVDSLCISIWPDIGERGMDDDGGGGCPVATVVPVVEWFNAEHPESETAAC